MLSVAATACVLVKVTLGEPGSNLPGGAYQHQLDARRGQARQRGGADQVLGQAKTHLQHVLTAAAINFVRVARWLDEVPVAQTRQSPFVTLMKQGA